jgi:hypothetical protein
MAESNILIRYPGSWGKLLPGAGDLQQKLRCAIRRASVGEPACRQRRFVHDVHPFLLDLPDDSVLLPHIVNAIIERAGARSMSQYYRRFEPVSISELVGAFLGNINDLLVVMNDTLSKEHVRAAASMMYLMHKGADLTRLPSCAQVMVDSYRPNISGSWYLRAAAFSVQDSIKLGHEWALSSMGQLIRLGGDDYNGRRMLDPILDTWRQWAHAPVNRSQKKGTWR